MEDTTSGSIHIESTDNNPLSCNQCPSAFGDQRELQTQKEERLYKCEQCDRCYRHSGSLVNHRKMHQLGLFPCLICQKAFSNLLALKNHLRIHSEEKHFKCTDCNEGFCMSYQLANHRWAAHGDTEHSYTLQNEEEDISSGRDSPDPAPPLLMENGSLLSNLENYIAESMVPADFSQLDFKDYGESKHFDETTYILKKDDTTITEERPPSATSDEERRFKCLQCGKAYKHAGSLANHRQSHTVGVYQCPVCFKEFSNLMALKNHCRIHSDHKPYKCTQCDICFRLPTELRNHQKLHTKEKSYVCDEGFSTKKDVQKHELLHTQELAGETCRPRSTECSENTSSEEEPIEVSVKPQNNRPQFQGHEIEDNISIPEDSAPHCNNGLNETPDPIDSISASLHIEEMNKLYEKESCLCSDLQSSTGELSLLYINHGNNFPDDDGLNNHACLDRKKDCVPQGQPKTVSKTRLLSDNREEPRAKGDAESRPYKCQQCGRTYRHAGSLINHKKSHQTGVYSCSLCSKQLFNLAALKNHLRAHLKSKNKVGTDIHHYNSLNLLSESLKASERSYNCSISGESFISESDLQQHESVHEDKVLSPSQDIPYLKNSSPGSLQKDYLGISWGSNTESAFEIEDNGDNKQESIKQEQALCIEQEPVPPIKPEPVPPIKQELVSSIEKEPVPPIESCPDEDPNISVKELGIYKDVQSPVVGSCALKKESIYGDSLSHQDDVDFQIQSKLGDHQISSVEGDLPEQSGQERRPYKCNLCGRTYRHRGSLVNHKHTHQTGVYQCSLCPKQYSNVMALRNHVRFHLRSSVGRNKPVDSSSSFQEVEKFYGCVFCSDTFEDPVDWHAHQMVHDSEKHLLIYQNDSKLQESPEKGLHGTSLRHQTNENNTMEVYPETTKNDIKGDECINDMDTNENGFRNVTKMPHICGCCGQNFHDINRLHNHSILHSSKVSSLPNQSYGNKNISGDLRNKKPENDQIPETDKVAETSIQAKSSEHPEHFGKKMYECNTCGKSYRHSGSLINHKRTHQTGDYCCAICSKQFNNLAALKNHLRIHLKAKRNSRLEDCDNSLLLMPESGCGLQSDPNISCSSCSDNLSNEMALQSHQLVPTGKELTKGECTLVDLSNSQNKSFNDSAEDSNMQNAQDLHTSNASQRSENENYGINVHEPRSPKGKDLLVIIKDQCLIGGVRICKGKVDLEDDRYHFGEDKILQQNEKEGHNLDSVSCSPPDITISINQTNSEGQLEESLDQGSNENSLYKCDLCGKSYMDAGSLISHKYTHLTGIYQCSFCPKEYNSLLALRSHFQTHTKSQMIRSVDSENGNLFRTPGDIQQLPNTQSEQLYDCSFCGLIFSEKVDFQQHQVSHDISHTSCDLEDNERSHQSLKEGQYQDGSTEHFAFHMHAAEKELLERLKHEMENLSQDIDTDGSYSSGTHISHICGYCGKTYDDLESFKAHNLSHSGDHNTSKVQNPQQLETNFANIEFPSNHISDTADGNTKPEIYLKSNFLTEEPKNNEVLDSRPFACSQCGKTYRHGGSLVNHKKTHQVGDYQCGSCSRQYPNLAAYRNHLRHHPKCKQQVSLHDESRVSQHISIESAQSEESGDTSQCSNGKEETLTHMSCSNTEDHNPGEAVKDCCGTTESAGESETSSSVDHSDERNPCIDSIDIKRQSSQPLKDSIVNMDYSGELNSSEDLRDTSKQKPLKCESCEKLCDGVTQLEDHKSLHCAGRSRDDMDGLDSAVNESGLPSCIDVSQTDYLESSFQETKHRPFKCELCDRTYRHAGSLINHKQTHKTGLFRCSICQKWFYNLMALKNHNRIHFETKRYKCADCGKAFRLQKQLSTHQKMHNERATLSRRSSRQNKQPFRKTRCTLDQEMHGLGDDEHAVSSESKGQDVVGKVDSFSSNNRHSSHPKRQRNSERPYQCEQCGRSYQHASSLQNHKKSHTTGHYCCSICDKTYSNLMALKNHQRTHFEVKRYQCAECGKAFKWQRQLAKHQLFHAEKKPYFCGLCGKTLHGRLLFEKHQLEHEEDKGGSMQDYTGDLTRGPVDKTEIDNEKTRVFKHSSALLNDSTAKGKHSVKTGDYKHSCKDCRQEFNSYDEMDSHLCICHTNKEFTTDSHPIHSSNQNSTDINFSQRCEEGHTSTEGSLHGVEKRPYQCNICGRTYRHAGSLLNHKNTHKTGLYKCSICLKQFYNPMAMKNHLRIHSAMKRFWCQECGKAFRASRELISHQRIHTGERPFCCLVCSRGFSSKLSLKQHQKTHASSMDSGQLGRVVENKKEDPPDRGSSPSNSVDEKTAQAIYSINDPLSDDVAIPEDERPYKCNQCERTYRHAGSLLNHKKTHKTGVYQCPTCHKEFFNLLALKNHLRIHLDRNRYKCSDCGKSFRVSSRLASHRRVHTQGGPFPCPLCGKKFLRKSSFQRHLLLHNNQENQEVKGSLDTVDSSGLANILVEVT